jgi:phenylacetate-CoA ligase
MLGGRMVVPVTKQKPPFWIRNTYMHQLYLSSYHLSSSTIKAYQQVIESFRPKYMFGYASSMYSLALLAKQQNLELPHLTCAISNAEPILAHQKILIEYVFNTKLVNTYGMSEMVASASSYQQEDLVLWPEIGLMEVLNFENDTPAPEGQNGRFICTSLLNKDMPLIRYEVGDSGSIGRCTSGINHYKINEVSGRTDDMVITASGTRIGRLDPVFKDNFNIIEAQIIQETYTDFTVKIVPNPVYIPENGNAIIAALRERVGNSNVTIEIVTHIPRSNTGKFKAVISNIKQQ